MRHRLPVVKDEPSIVVVPMLQFECQQGHVFQRATPMVVQFDDSVRSRPICPYCYADWISNAFGATEVVPAEPEGGNL